MEDVRKHSHFLSVLSDLSVQKTVKQAIYHSGPKSLILVLCTCAHNVLRGACELSEEEVNELRPHREFLYKLANLSQTLSQKRKLVVSESKKSKSGLEVLLPIVLNFVLCQANE